MTSKRATIYLRKNTLEAIGRTGEGELSLRIAAMLTRYRELCKALMPAFTRAEWCAIVDANNGTAIDIMAADDVQITPVGVWANVDDSAGLGEKWEIDQKNLVRRMQELSRAELLAVEEACVRFWQFCDLDTDEALKLAWVTPAPDTEEPNRD